MAGDPNDTKSQARRSAMPPGSGREITSGARSASRMTAREFQNLGFVNPRLNTPNRTGRTRTGVSRMSRTPEMSPATAALYSSSSQWF